MATSAAFFDRAFDFASASASINSFTTAFVAFNALTAASAASAASTALDTSATTSMYSLSATSDAATSVSFSFFVAIIKIVREFCCGEIISVWSSEGKRGAEIEFSRHDKQSQISFRNCI